jgi:hypothetical protein
MSIRVLIILSSANCTLSIDRVTAIDFISIYGKDFGISDENLHGNNSYRFSEFTSKREIATKALKELVLRRYVKASCNKGGFSYKITDNGRKYCERLNDEYAKMFLNNSKMAILKFDCKTDREIIHLINEQAILMFGGSLT